ncbi:MAG: hypothetical protein IJR54_06160 [Oscillibacter sp.]|nr:hypothetical protein [Oscillibacter sp.]
MATWRTNTTTTDDGEPSKLQEFRDNFLSFLWKLVKILALVIFLLAEFCSVPTPVDTRSNPTDIRQEMDSLIQSGTTRELELDLDNDLDLYNTMMALVTNMKFGDFKLDGSKAQEFWTAYTPAKADTTLEYIQFDSEERRVLLRYSNGINADITMEFDTGYLYKAVILRNGVFNGSILRWAYWNLIGRFVQGYPCYITEANLNGNGIRGDVTVRKYTLRNQLFSWSFPPKKNTQLENVTEHWT